MSNSNIPEDSIVNMLEKLNMGDVVRIGSFDVYHDINLTFEEMMTIVPQEMNVAIGIIMNIREDGIVVAHTMAGNPVDEGYTISLYPYQTIESIKVIGHEDLGIEDDLINVDSEANNGVQK